MRSKEKMDKRHRSFPTLLYWVCEHFTKQNRKFESHLALYRETLQKTDFAAFSFVLNTE